MRSRGYWFFLFVVFASVSSTAQTPRRIVSLAPVATEFLFALGLKDNIVGVTTYCDRPVEAKSIAKIGGFADPQLESIIKLHPNLVVATPFGNAKNIVNSLSNRNIQTLSQPVESLGDIKKFLASLGKITGRAQEAQKLQNIFDSEFAALKDSLSSRSTNKRKLRVLLLVSSSPLIGAGRSTFMGEILEHLGAENVITATSPWPVLSLEMLLRAPPDVIVITEGKRALEQTRSQLAPLLSKYADHLRIFAPDESLLQRPGIYLTKEALILRDGLKLPHA